MSDNIGYTPGSGEKVASRRVIYSSDIVQAQAVGLVTFSGIDDAKTVQDVSETNPLPVAGYGELIETLEAIRMAMNSLNRAAGLLTVDTTGRLRVLLDSITASLTLAAITTVSTVSTVSTVTTLSTMTNQSQMGGLAANDQIPALMTLRADNLRSNIVVT